MSSIPYDFSHQNTTLVHICCSVDSHHFLTQLQKIYPNKHFCGFFYNPNIHPYEEYQLRLEDVKRSCEALGIPLIVGEYDDKEWLANAKGLENAPEKGERCSFCFDFRLSKTAQIAQKTHCTEFTTTLLASPMKSQAELFAQGETIARSWNLNFLPLDVRSKGGTKVQNELAKNAKLYRQNYCGCIFALKAQRNKPQRVALELLSSLSTPQGMRNLPSLRFHNFQTRAKLEKQCQPYQIIKRKVSRYVLLQGKLTCQERTIPSFICSYSLLTKPAKARIEFWHNGIGYANKEGILLLLFKNFKTILNKPDFATLLREGLDEEVQLLLRHKLYPYGFLTSPILIIERPIEDFMLEISSIMQEEMLEDFLPL
ncbi:epoxyqueuosine reductase QueH [Helicobacter sp.]|uniref:epoxyqueuosine reductase QueH n=1 Tax=Helicobacter sp. TaxID=218 RepID=UPI00198C57C9|nr:epoxyqueuosine reductase QueH [Helicobacter sp.]MBD5164627.1 epoxyqueuosine reductase QueH [Helicobacter sp.]